MRKARHDSVHFCTHSPGSLCVLHRWQSLTCMAKRPTVLRRLQSTCCMAVRPSGSWGRARRSAAPPRRRGTGACCAAKRRIGATQRTSGSSATEGARAALTAPTSRSHGPSHCSNACRGHHCSMGVGTLPHPGLSVPWSSCCAC